MGERAGSGHRPYDQRNLDAEKKKKQKTSKSGCLTSSRQHRATSVHQTKKKKKGKKKKVITLPEHERVQQLAVVRGEIDVAAVHSYHRHCDNAHPLTDVAFTHETHERH